MGTPPAPPAPLPTAEEERVKRRSRRAVLVVVAVLVAAGIVALAFVGVSVYSLFDLGRSWPQPDAPLISRFQTHRAEFQELLLLAWADDGRGPDGRRVRAGVKKPYLDAGQRRRYRQLKRLLGIQYVDIYGGEADFTTQSWGIVPSGWSQGYSWEHDTPSPLVDDTQNNDSTSENVWRRLGGHWYLNYETW